MNQTLFAAEDVRKYFPVSSGWGLLSKNHEVVKAVDGVTFSVPRGQVLSLVGESGCGKTTIARMIMGLLPPTGGRLIFEGVDILKMNPGEGRVLRRKMQIVFQNPYASLNPRMTVERIVGLPLRAHRLAKGRELRNRVVELLHRVGLTPPETFLPRYPHELSGGQRQRIGIARALAPSPTFIVFDEPVAALDMSIKSQILNLLVDLKQKLGLTYLFISHDLATVRYMSDWIAVIYLGRIIESGPSEEIFQQPEHPYTRALLSAVPGANPEVSSQRLRLRGDIPSPLNPPPGCRFHTRCPYAERDCYETFPNFDSTANPNHRVACHLRPFKGLAKSA